MTEPTSDAQTGTSRRDPTAVLSPSKIDLFLRCQAAWAFRYLDGLKKPPSAAMALGNAHDATTNAVYTAKMVEGRTPPLGDSIDRFAHEWDEARGNVEDWGDDDPRHLQAVGVRATELWHKRAARYVEPEQVQPKLRTTLRDAERGEDFDVIGYADLIAKVSGHRTIVDHKMGRRSWAPADVVRSTQSVAYPVLVGDINRFAIHSTRIGNDRSTYVSFNAITRQVRDTDRTGFVNQAVLARRQMRSTIASGDFVPNRSHFLCSRRWCGYWRECQQRFGGTVAP